MYMHTYTCTYKHTHLCNMRTYVYSSQWWLRTYVYGRQWWVITPLQVSLEIIKYTNKISHFTRMHIMHTYIHAYIQTYILAYVHTCIQTKMHIKTRTSINTFTTCVHTYNTGRSDDIIARVSQNHRSAPQLSWNYSRQSNQTSKNGLGCVCGCLSDWETCLAYVF